MERSASSSWHNSSDSIKPVCTHSPNCEFRLILSGVFTGGNHAGRVKDPFTDFSGPQNIGHLFFVMKPNLFVGKNFNKRIKDNIKTIKKLPKIKGVKEILYPGQSKYNRYKNNSKKEISIPKDILKELTILNNNI